MPHHPDPRPRRRPRGVAPQELNIQVEQGGGIALFVQIREQIRDLLFAGYSRKLPNLPLLFLADRIVAVPELDGWENGSGSGFGTTLEQWHFAAVVAAVKK